MCERALGRSGGEVGELRRRRPSVEKRSRRDFWRWRVWSRVAMALIRSVDDPVAISCLHKHEYQKSETTVRQVRESDRGDRSGKHRAAAIMGVVLGGWC